MATAAPAEGGRVFGEPLRVREAPTFRPTAEQFAHPLEFIASIRHIAEPFGICKIVPPEGWRPPCAIDKSTFRFPTRIQNVNELQDRSSSKWAQRRFLKELEELGAKQGKPARKGPVFAGQDVDLFKMFKAVQRRGGYQKVTADKAWKDIARILKVGVPRRWRRDAQRDAQPAPPGAQAPPPPRSHGSPRHLQVTSTSTNTNYGLRQLYQKCLLSYEQHVKSHQGAGGAKQEPAPEEQLPSEEEEAVEAAEILEAMLGGGAELKEPPAKKRKVERPKRGKVRAQPGRAPCRAAPRRGPC
jgi:histone demethylase JARID1